jgi:hypothetical protein
VEVPVKLLPWILLVVSIVVFLIGAVYRLSGGAVLSWLPMDAGTYWKGAVGLVLYAIAFRMFGSRTSSAP